MSYCVPRRAGGYSVDQHEFEHFYDEVDEEYFPVHVYMDDDEDVIESKKCHRAKKTYVKSICKHCGEILER